ncbi:DnaT-like ssDNA-binding domain-containing protein [Marinobacterium stanieri]|uniref:DnaT-like ssDNA-binding domain-containing protein n=1 Tax=Marinobacterium stanieri TaxID=49186 RepID=UPI00025588B0|nr:DnaT-like ssDNA-binding domain-containing protein [Marinobacterium stanieri]
MQYTLSINQTKALEWGLNAQQAVLFSFVYECPSWCKPVTKGDAVFYALSKQKIIDELPLLTDKTDTAYRLLKQLAAKGVIEVSHTNSITLVRLTDIGKSWNHDHTGSEKFPSKGRKNVRSKVGNKSEAGRKKIRSGSENSPTNQDTSNPVDAGASSRTSFPDHSPGEATEHEHHEAIFGHVDSGPSVPSSTSTDRNSFAMHWQWMPSPWFSERYRTAGVNLSSLEPAQQESILGEFRSYWEASGREFNQAQWEHKLLRQLLQRVPASAGAAANQSRQQRRADLSASVMDIEDTSWGD